MENQYFSFDFKNCLFHQDVAVKVYFGSEYIEGTLKNYQKEVLLQLLSSVY